MFLILFCGYNISFIAVYFFRLLLHYWQKKTAKRRPKSLYGRSLYYSGDFRFLYSSVMKMRPFIFRIEKEIEKWEEKIKRGYKIPIKQYKFIFLLKLLLGKNDCLLIHYKNAHWLIVYTWVYLGTVSYVRKMLLTIY